MRTAMEKDMMVQLPAIFERYLGYNWQRNVELGFNTIYVMNVSDPSAITTDHCTKNEVFH